MIFLRRLVLAALPILLFGLYANRPELAFIPWFGLVPWVILYTDDRAGKVSAWWFVAAVLLTWVVEHASLFDFGWYAPFVMVLALGLFRIPFAPVLSRIHHHFHLPRTLTVPLVWVAVELLRATFTLSNMDLFRLGYSQARFPVLVQFADITGAYGVSFLIGAVNGLIADAWFGLRDAGWSVGTALRRRRFVISAVAVAAAFLTVTVYGVVRSAGIRLEPGPRVAVVQPNIPHTIRNLVGVHLAQLLMIEEQVPAGSVDLIILPENAIMDNIQRRGVYLDDLAWIARQKGARVLVGALGDDPERAGYSLNGAFLVNGAGEIEGSYYKQMLFPWSEFVPGDDLTRRILPGFHRFHRRLTRMGWGFLPTGRPGDETTVMNLDLGERQIPFTSLICVENCYPRLAAEAGQMGARFYVNITSEGSVAGPVQEQLLRIAIMRAIENRMSYVRCGNNGISGIIDPLGRVTAILTGETGQAINVAGVHIDQIPVSTGRRTFYSVSRELFAHGVLAAAALLWLATFMRRKNTPGARTVAAIGVTASILFLGGCVPAPSLGEDPTVVESRIQEGNRAVREGRYEEASQLYLEACATEAGCERVLDPIATCFRNERQVEAAALFYGAVAERHPALEGRAKAWEGRFLEQGLYLPEALEAYGTALAVAETAEVYGMLGRLQMKMGDLDAAKDALHAGLALDPEDGRVQYALARAHHEAGELDAAIEVLEQLVDRDVRNGNAWALLGMVLYQRGETERALQVARSCLGIDPDNIQARFMVARFALRQGDLELFRRQLARIRNVEATLGRGPLQE